MGRYTPMNVLFDTGSDWVVVEDVNCDTCEGNKYDARQGEKISEEESTRAYGTVFFNGNVYSDTICIQLSACVPDFEYFAISEQIGLREPIDGIMGLARNNIPTFHRGEGTISTTKSYVTAMKEADLINNETFSFYFNNLESSYVDFGQYQETSITGDIKYVDTFEDFFWSLSCSAVGFGQDVEEVDDITQKKFKDPIYTIIDTSSPTISIAGSYFDKYVEAIFDEVSGNDYQVEQGQVLTDCGYDYPNLYFMIGEPDSGNEYWVEVRPEEYVLDVSEDQNRELCILAISKNSEDFNIFGNPLL